MITFTFCRETKTDEQRQVCFDDMLEYSENRCAGCKWFGNNFCTDTTSCRGQTKVTANDLCCMYEE